MYSTRPFLELIKNESNKKLVFIHTPKCAGSYVSQILSHLNIKSNCHEQAIPNDDYIYFTVIRNPVERFESLLNYRLGQEKLKINWPKHLLYVYDDNKITLDEIISKMTDDDILGFSPFKTINYWTKNVDIIITLDNLPRMLKYFGYTYDRNLFKSINVSKKIRGQINNFNKNRIELLFNDDVKIYNMVINSTF